MDAERALADLLDLCGDLEAAIVLDEAGVLASSLDEERTAAWAEAVRDVVVVAERVKPGAPAPVERVDAVVAGGRLLAVCGEGLTVAAATARTASAPLVLHDLGALLRELVAGRTAETVDARA